jgi:putative ubiquitin-RnfH superfamily antitoxin RatB of RatAB toxin-antitoxin module
MADERAIAVELVYCSTTRQHVFALRLAAGSTVRDAIRSSGLAAQCPEIEANALQVGVYGRVVALGTVLQDGDRVEIYRPLVADPKQARRRRASTQR